MHYLTIPEPITILNPLTNEVAPDPTPGNEGRPQIISFARSARVVITAAMQKGDQEVLFLLDLVKKTDSAVGARIELSDAEHKLLADGFRKPDPKAFGTGWMAACEPHVRAVIDAPTTLPASAVPAAPATE